MDILRFITAGSIDDGKSTLIGRLLVDTKNLKADILESIATGDKPGEVNLAFVTDGLRAERQAGITIDVAYKYFTTPRRKYIITDAPGHFQYTKNLVTGASGADAIIILVDAQIGISAQTRRHALVASFLQIGNVVLAVNKMDLVGYDAAVFDQLCHEFRNIADRLGLKNVRFIPMSALQGDNVTVHSARMPWYTGDTLLQFLENCSPLAAAKRDRARFQVQYEDSGYVYGRLLTGGLKVGDPVEVYPGGVPSIVEGLLWNKSEVPEAGAGQDVCVLLKAGTSAKRGDLIAAPGSAPCGARAFEADICWLDDARRLDMERNYLLRIHSAVYSCRIIAILSVTDSESFVAAGPREHVSVNEIGKVKIQVGEEPAYDPFVWLRETGRAILIDPESNNTSAALIIR